MSDNYLDASATADRAFAASPSSPSVSPVPASIPSAERGDRPSRHGAKLGAVIAEMARIGRETLPDLADNCLTCAFKEGTAPNQMAGTGLTAFKCAMGVDPDPFGCHHGMQDGSPTRLCAGYYAAQHALKTSYGRVKELILTCDLLSAGDGDDDDIRAQYDVWIEQVDPHGKLDVYQTARLWAAQGIAARSDETRSGSAV